jgi:guanine deaminase
MSAAEILRATIFHTPGNPFQNPGAMASFEDGALLIEDGVIQECGDFPEVRKAHTDADVRDLRGGILLPGFVDTHVHYPQVRVLGAIGYTLLEWLQRTTLPEETKFANVEYARTIAGEFVHALASHGTTTALVFGSHFAQATAELFEAAERTGLRIASGQVLSDRMLLPELHQTPEDAYRESTTLIRRFHCKGRLLYAVTPRFALSSSEAMLDVCRTLIEENDGVLFQTHLNESEAEVAAVAKFFPSAPDYFGVYENHKLAGPRSIFAHSVQTTERELTRMAALGCSVAYCPCSNAALGSGLFPLNRHLAAGVHCALGTDVGGGTGFGMLKEGLQAYLLQRLTADGVPLGADHLLYLATRAGAESMGLADRIGDFTPGKSADFVYLRPPEQSSLAAVCRNAPDLNRLLASVFTLAGQESVREVCVEGSVVYRC